MSDDDRAALRRDATSFFERYLDPALAEAKDHGENPAVMIYALLDAAMRAAAEHFPGQAENLYVSATQMVFEAHQGEAG